MDRTDVLPGSEQRWTCLVSLIALAFLPVVFVLGNAAAAEGDHPSLVNADSSGCATCHEDLIADFEVVHAPVVDDCTMCHDVAIEDSGTTIALVDDEPSLCTMCHDEMASAVAGDLNTPHYPVTESCLTCHEAHASDNQSLLQAKQAELCASCHDSTEIAELHHDQLTEGTRCANCHRPHGSDAPKLLVGQHQHRPFADGSCNGCHRDPFGDRVRLRSRGERLCTACHSDLANLESEGTVVHAALTGERGKAGCLGCHDPHMSDQSALLVHEGPDLCATCHGSIVKASRGKSGHVPAAEDCTNCHVPHSSTHRALLSEQPVELCKMCHDVDDDDLEAVHLGGDLNQLDCLTCHTPHGNDNPSLLAEYLHPPLLDGCDTCHEGSVEQLAEDGESTLCLMCHDDIGEQAEKSEVPHAALEVGRCVDCHDAHASSQPNLLSSSGGEFCTECHAEQAAAEGEVQHGVIDLIGCQACHTPHGGDNARLLRIVGDDLCVACHVAKGPVSRDGAEEVLLLDRFAVPSGLANSIANLRLTPGNERGHPVPNHRVKGQPTAKELKHTDTTFTGEMSCLTCHDPHKGRSELILNWGAVTSMNSCMHCHPK